MDEALVQKVIRELSDEFGFGAEGDLTPEFFAGRDEGGPLGEVYQAFAKWARVRGESKYGQRRPLDKGIFLVEADHSFRGGLLGYIVAGNEPHPVPPPRYYSRPAHWLVDAGPEGVQDKLAISKLPWKDNLLGVGHDAWEIVEEQAEGDYIIKYDENGLWRATMIEAPESDHSLGVWHLRPWMEG